MEPRLEPPAETELAGLVEGAGQEHAEIAARIAVEGVGLRAPGGRQRETGPGNVTLPARHETSGGGSRSYHSS